MKEHPFRCKEHPQAQVKHSWDEDYVTRRGHPVIRNDRYECNECGKRLARNQKEARCLEA